MGMDRRGRMNWEERNEIRIMVLLHRKLMKIKLAIGMGCKSKIFTVILYYYFYNRDINKEGFGVKKLSLLSLSIVLFIGVFSPSGFAEKYDSSFCEQFEGASKIWWDGAELKPGQIGRLTVLKDTHLFKLNGSKKVIHRTLKTGENYRIYAFKPGMLSVGGGYYVDRDTKVKYETPSKTKLKAVECVHNPYGSIGNASVVGDVWEVEVEDWFDGYKRYDIGLVDALTDGEAAWELIKEANMFNTEPPAGKKYVLALFYIKLYEYEGKVYNSWNVNSSLFTAVSKSGKVYNWTSIVTPEPSFSSLYEGGETFGMVAYLVDENDQPKIVWQKDSADEIWFKLD
jgi:hypothetical protein